MIPRVSLPYETRCFDKRIMQEFVNKLNIYARRKHNMYVKYFIVSELGGLTHRPHHHAILYFYPLDPSSYSRLSLIRTTALIDFVTSMWSRPHRREDGVPMRGYGICDVKECDGKGGLQYVAKYTGKDVVNQPLFESYVALHRSELKRLLSEHKLGYEAYKLARRRLSHFVRRFGNFTMMSQGVGTMLEDSLSDVDFVEKPFVWVNHFKYALPRYYVDRYNRRTLKEQDCEKISECPKEVCLSSKRAAYRLANIEKIQRARIHRLTPELHRFFLAMLDCLEPCENQLDLYTDSSNPWSWMCASKTGDEFIGSFYECNNCDGNYSFDSVQVEIALTVCEQIQSERQSKYRDSVKLKNEQDKIAMKSTLVQKGGYRLLNEYKLQH